MTHSKIFEFNAKFGAILCFWRSYTLVTVLYMYFNITLNNIKNDTSGKPCKILFINYLLLKFLHNDESEGCSGPVDVIVPLVDIAESLADSEFAPGDAVDLPRPLEPLRDIIFRFRSSLSKLFNGDTLISELRLLEVAVCIWMLPENIIK